MKYKRRTYVAISAVVFFLAALCIVLKMHVSFAGSDLFNEAYAAISVAFDKQAMRSADRIVIRTGESEIQITDPELIGQIVEETAAATHMKVTCPEERWIDVYCGDRLIRSMGWSDCCDTVNVYNSDASHWVISVEGMEDGG
ncbi:MAG: hypothetical protein IJW67_13490, partial [Blautia sp.]|nr:hypothetical protein [Blautia sp.]